jgi:DNA-directed RNA polymerase specialized sigma24 family protein
LLLLDVMENLTEKVLRFQRTREGLSDIVDELAPRVYRFPRRKMGWDEDACGDFYVFVHPRLIRLIDRFRDQGRPFESYLWAVLNWQLRNFARERKRGERAWNVSLRLEPERPGSRAALEDPSEDAAAEPLRLPPGVASIIRSDADRRNFLFLALKCSRCIEPENATYLSGIAGIIPERLLSLALELRQMRVSRERRLETFRCRRNKAFAQARLLETELQAEVEPRRKETLEIRLGRARQRMKSALKRMARVGLSPTNLEISRVVGVPKGTVDSGLYWLKRKLASVYDPDNLRSA